MENTCTNCANDCYKGTIDGPTCEKWKAKDMTANSVPIENKEVSKLPDGGVEIKCKVTDGERPEWYRVHIGDDAEEKTCKNCGYRGSGYIEYNMPSSIVCWCKYHSHNVDGPTCDHWKAMDMTVDDNEKEKTFDPVNSPKHYTSGKVECIDAMIETFGVEAVKHFCLCNAFKYHWRHELKNGDEDIKKATWYMNKYKELENR